MSKIVGCKVLSPSTVNPGSGGWTLHTQVSIQNNGITTHVVTYEVVVGGHTVKKRTVDVLPGGGYSTKVDKPSISMPDPATASYLPSSGSVSVSTRITQDYPQSAGLLAPEGEGTAGAVRRLEATLGARASHALTSAGTVPAARDLVHAGVTNVD